ncbi:hypothetical protein EC960932_0755, partial [Escherichia coli 96.0932]
MASACIYLKNSLYF